MIAKLKMGGPNYLEGRDRGSGFEANVGKGVSETLSQQAGGSDSDLQSQPC
jgi:hypothetical protein